MIRKMVVKLRYEANDGHLFIRSDITSPDIRKGGEDGEESKATKKDTRTKKKSLGEGSRMGA
jgi:hypothetical protein